MPKILRKKEATGDTAVRERLLRVALQLFNAKGYAATSVREIVAAAGVSKPTLYYYFTSKEGIYLELMTVTLANFQGMVSEFIFTEGKARERIGRFATGVFDSFIAQLDVVRLIYAIFFGPPQGAPYFRHQEFFDLMISAVAEMIEAGKASGEFRPVAVNDVTWAVISCMNTVMEEQLCNQPPRVGREDLERMLGLLLDGISAKSED